MNEIIIKTLKAFAVGVIGGIVFDLQKWVEGVDEETGKIPVFDWKLAVKRWVKAGLTAVGGIWGISVI